jgi:4-amino-4-deoxy-L-arabinose transferase-like glycosyltransferase
MLENLRSGANRLAKSAWSPIVLLVLVGIVVGILIGDDYGMSWDEQRNFLVGADALQAYLNPAQYYDYLESGDPLAHHGPSYFMTFFVTSKAYVSIFQDWHRADARHLSNFFAFLMGCVAFYWLALRWMSRRTAWMTTIFMLSQPLLFGHAFINQKDTPFLAFFTASVALGMAAVDALVRRRAQPDTSSAGISAKDPAPSPADAARPRLRRWLWGILAVLGLVLFADLVYFDGLLRLGQEVLKGIWPRLEGALSPDALSAAVRQPDGAVGGVEWLEHLYRISRATLAGLAGLLAFAAARRAHPGLSGKGPSWGRSSIILTILAGAFTGYLASIRPIGLFAGALVMLYWGMRLRGKDLQLMGVYGLVAAWAMYQTWPWLWSNPVNRMWETFALTTDFGMGHTLYRGVSISSEEVPWHYFPTLAAIELTIPALALFPVGAVIAALRVRAHRIDVPTTTVIGLWFAVPLFALSFLGVGVYNNIRQLHFVLVPLFLVCGLSLEVLLAKLRRRLAQYAVFLALVAPGIVGIYRLHPYEYAYFNALVGGVQGADGRFATEYWCTSLREATDYINREAATGDLVLVLGADRAVEPFAREDLIVTRILERAGEADILATCKDTVGRDRSEGGWTRVFEVSREGALFAEVFER